MLKQSLLGIRLAEHDEILACNLADKTKPIVDNFLLAHTKSAKVFVWVIMSLLQSAFDLVRPEFWIELVYGHLEK